LSIASAAWVVSELLLSVKERRFRYPGSEAALAVELEFGSGVSPPESAGRVSCWRHLDEWWKAGVWERLQELLLARLRASSEIE
jgi:hypothetical protein